MKPLAKRDLTKNTKPPENYVLYILMRNDIQSLNPGKAMAQAAHASNQFIHYWGDQTNVKQWQGEHGFGTTIVLSATGEQIDSITREVIVSGRVYDETYPFVVDREIASLLDPTKIVDKVFRENGEGVVCFRNELTCGYVFVIKDSSIQRKLVGDLPLHP